VDPDLAEYFFQLHQEIEPFEQDEGWEYVSEVVRTDAQRAAFKRAYICKILSERRKDEGLLRRMKRRSGAARAPRATPPTRASSTGARWRATIAGWRRSCARAWRSWTSARAPAPSPPGSRVPSHRPAPCSESIATRR